MAKTSEPEQGYFSGCLGPAQPRSLWLFPILKTAAEAPTSPFFRAAEASHRPMSPLREV